MTEPGISVIGGGITGASVAYHLSKETDRPVTVYEQRDKLSMETTNKSGAFVGYWGHEPPGRLQMMDYSMRLYNRFLDDAQTNLSYHFSPRLQVATTDDGVANLRERFKQNLGATIEEEGITTGMRRSPVQYLPSNRLAGSFLLPELELGPVMGATYSGNLGHLWPARQAAQEFVLRARENGVSFETGREVTEIVTKGGRVSGLIVDGEEIETDEVICTAGPWNKNILRAVGIDLPLKHTLGPMLVLQPQKESPHSLFSLKHEETGYYMRQNPDGTVFLGNNPGSYESAGTEYDPGDVTNTVPEELRSEGLEVAKSLLPYLEGANVVDEWVGVRSLTPDTEPIIGWTSIQGLSVASFNASGIQLSPCAGKIIANQVVHDEPTAYYESVSVSRFEGYGDYR
ncbi:NAD(P)/FAD-dependent oxidoreductase [Halorussus marinus]|uniref:NAD(P)/FAD-dependent oxidoreductase n=1 Tax=Halorussus marinus TaxID=2505976 RepID=UPI001092F07F|nr:FAD-dependent oxidoreductase [Halorussus marinus]